MTTNPQPKGDMAWLDEILYHLYESGGNSKYIRADHVGKPLTPDQAKAAIATHIQREKELAVVEARVSQTKRIGNLIKQAHAKMLETAGMLAYPEGSYTYDDIIRDELAVWAAQLTKASEGDKKI